MDAKAPDELACDFAETYHVFDRQSLPLQTAATLAAGLSADSRTKRALAGTRLDLKTVLLAMAVDRLAELVWTKTKDAKKGRNKPDSVLRILEQKPARPKRAHLTFDSAEAFEAARAKMLQEVTA